MLDGWIRDFRYAARRLGRRGTYTALTVLTLSLGVAGTAAVYSIIEQLLLEPVPARAEEEVVVFWFEGAWSEAEFLHLRPEIGGFSSLAAFRLRDVTLQSPGGPARLIDGVAASAELFDVLGVAPAIGPGFQTGDDRVGVDPVAVLSHGFWRELGSDPSILGQTIELGGLPREVVGVMPEGFWFPNPMVQVWMSETLNPEDGSGNWGIIGRLEPGTGPAAMAGELERIMQYMHVQFDYAEGQWDTRRDPHLIPLREYLVGEMRPSLLAALAAMGVILLIACVNVAALMLGQADSRETELAVRSALGEGRRLVLRQMFVESITIGLLAGIVSAFLAVIGFQFLVAALPLGALADAARVEWPLLAGAVGIAVVAASLVAIAPAVSVVRSNLQTKLTRSRTSGIGGRGGRLEGALVVAQVALVLLIAASAGLLIRSVTNLRSIDVGVDVESVAVIDIVMPVTTPNSSRAAVVAGVLESVRAIPGVTAAGATQRLPLRGSSDNWGLEIDSRPEVEDANTAFRIVTPGYFEAMGIELRRGRLLDESDRSSDVSEGTVVINEAFAERYLPGRDPIGERIRFMDRPDRIVGVVGNVAEAGLTPEPQPARYVASEQVPWLLPGQTIVLRVEEGRDPGAVLDSARRAIQAGSPSLAIQETTTMRNVLDRAVGPARQVMALLALLGGLALLLGAIGVFGVVSHFVTRRRRDWGIRVALGLEPASVMRRIVGTGAALVLGGILLGLVAFLLVAHLLGSLLYGVGASDPLTLTAAAGILLLAGILAASIPAWRASRIDPANVLREP